jgi:hypothetical protein
MMSAMKIGAPGLLDGSSLPWAMRRWVAPAALAA